MPYPKASESLRDLIYFVTTAREQSITGAADKLGMSKSAVGKSISRLEAQLDTQLFHRNTRNIHLTTEGEMYLHSCISALDILSAAEDALQSKSQGPSGVVRIDMPAAFGRQVVLPILLKIGDQFPKLQLTLTFNDKVIDPMGEGFDLALRFGPLKESADLVARPLNPQQLVLCASPAYLKEHGYPKSMQGLTRHQCVMAWRSAKPLSWLLKGDDGKDIKFSPPAHYQISDGDAMIKACIAGAGIAQFPRSLLKEALASGELELILPELNPEKSALNIIWPRKRQLMPGMRFIVDEFLRLSEQGAFL